MLTSRNERPAGPRLRALAWLAGAALSLVPAAVSADAASEAAASAMLDQVSGNAARLRMFLQAMPKGGDLHNHLGGSVYAEDFLDVAAQKGMCADAGITRIVPGPCSDELQIAKMASERPFVFAQLVDALSTRGYQRGVGADEVSGHTQFFRSFDRFGAASTGENGRWLALARQSAARNGVSYLELMLDPPGMAAFVRAAGTGPADEAGIAALYAKDSAELAPLLDGFVKDFDQIESEANAQLSCGTAAADPACDVAVHYLTYAMRGFPPRMAWRTLLVSFAMAHRDPRVVGVNIVMPEDDPVALRDYGLHMAMFRFLEARYPDVSVTMHAGELALGLVPPADLADHIARAVASGARRIGHGTDIAYEDKAPETLARMAREGIAVEVNLTSNAVILGVKGGEHPIALYRSMGVPVALSTDDEGVLRSDMTNEYRRAVTDQGLGYADLKSLARASLEYAFLPGASLWRDRKLGTAVADCAASFESKHCKPFLAANEKARLQADLETRFDRFEHALGRFNYPQGS
ncbi:adenosine deaminase family protein [Novosphingobium album (ex Hu et al. 2023)]|uniref:adenosine deaminase n=1 Tax=Novosphingobium album (ex Hu et al. 2023) TaxID=2930093 RepID=A0ABT0B1S0_9SPHN|nr:adenosine deaminase [Novosphingobium album (ex Hu et al. 2023)]MCJ2179016.1 adenosine deaminase [Novosphingobium album (ex Hu et al. 2023)]